MTQSRLLLLIGALVLAGCGRSQSSGLAGAPDPDTNPRHDGVIALVGAVLIDGTASPPRAGTVLIRGDRIVCAGECAVNAGMQVVDLTGRYIIPGLVVSVANLVVWLTVGFAWWKFLGFW